MTTTPSSTATTTLIRRADKIALSTSYDFTALGVSTAMPETLRSSIDQAITQWWNGLTRSQRSEPLGRELNFKISVSYR